MMQVRSNRKSTGVGSFAIGRVISRVLQRLRSGVQVWQKQEIPFKVCQHGRLAVIVIHACHTRNSKIHSP